MLEIYEYVPTYNIKYANVISSSYSDMLAVIWM